MKSGVKDKSIVITSLRLPEDVYRRIMTLTGKTDIDFSEFIQRAIRRDMEISRSVNKNKRT